MMDIEPISNSDFRNLKFSRKCFSEYVDFKFYGNVWWIDTAKDEGYPPFRQMAWDIAQDRLSLLRLTSALLNKIAI